MMLVKVVSVPPNSDKLTKRSHDVCFICGNRGINQSYHKIPTSSPIREKWLEALRIFEYNSSIRVCSIHFKKEDFCKSGENSKRILTRNAIPSKLLTVRFGETKLAETMQKGTKKCCVCGAKDSSLTYHVFPSEPNLRKKWADACGFKDHLLLRTKQICGNHFQREDYNYCMKLDPKADKSRRTLRKDVVPSLLLGGNACERKNTIINIPPPYRPLAPKGVNTVVLKNLNNLSSLTMPPTLTQITPVSVNPAVLSSLCVVLGDQNTNRSEAIPKTTQVASSSSSTTSQVNKKSSTSEKPAQTKSSEVVDLSDSDADKTNAAPTDSVSSASAKTSSSVPAKTNPSTLTRSDPNDSRTDEDRSNLLADDEDSNFSIDELILEEPMSDEEHEENSNSKSNNRPAKNQNSTSTVRSSARTKYRPILPAPSLTVENIKLIEALALKNGLRTADHSYERKPTKSTKPSAPLLWRYPSDIGPAHCNTPNNAWRAVQILKSTIDKQKVEIRGLQQFKRRTLIKMQKMTEELQAFKKNSKVLDDLDDVEPWWV